VRTVVVGGTQSGVGKTTVALGLLAALRARGLAVQPFKVGPDYLDGIQHAAAAGRSAANLDGWLLGREASLRIAARRAAGADAGVVEGCMGLFDGFDGTSEDGSTAQVAKWLGAPVVLVLDAWALSRSAAAMVHGFATFDPDLRLAGVVLNRVAGAAHERWLRAAIAQTGVPVLGALPLDERVVLPERHLGLHLEARPDLEVLGALVEAHVDLDALLAAAAHVAPEATPPRAPARARIAVGRDEAFCFVYEDALEELRRAGAELVPFSPLRDGLPDDVGGVYLPGGYPELHAAQLAANVRLAEDLRVFEGVVWGECGGLMALGEAIEDLDGRRHPALGVLPHTTRMTPRVTVAYAELAPAPGSPFGDAPLRGHLFHRSERVGGEGLAPAWRATTDQAGAFDEGMLVGSRIVATYAHLHLAAHPAAASAFVEACAS
jgi:cobyrinic acid a,c-diamide synthase